MSSGGQPAAPACPDRTRSVGGRGTGCRASERVPSPPPQRWPISGLNAPGLRRLHFSSCSVNNYRFRPLRYSSDGAPSEWVSMSLSVCLCPCPCLCLSLKSGSFSFFSPLFSSLAVSLFVSVSLCVLLCLSVCLSGSFSQTVSLSLLSRSLSHSPCLCHYSLAPCLSLISPSAHRSVIPAVAYTSSSSKYSGLVRRLTDD